MLDLMEATDEELTLLLARIRQEQDRRLPLDPLPWAWHNYNGAPPIRRREGPQNDGPPYPNGTLSVLAPRFGYRQDPQAYDHTRLTWIDEYLDETEKRNG